MLNKTVLVLAAFLISVPYLSSQGLNTSLPSKSVVSVLDGATAIRIAKKAIKISDPEPKAELKEGTWTVTGRSCCGKPVTCEPGRCTGGGEQVVIRQRDGKILSAKGFK